ncbi:unnamed protein product [Zymoseptoria tritici ST99CH_3D1]|nr:unnamed protein product [Zymoseptoria tritici ST99CH_3D1]
MTSYDWQGRKHRSNGHSHEYLPPREQDVRTFDRERRTEPSHRPQGDQQDARHESTRSSYNSQPRSYSGSRRYHPNDPSVRARDQQAPAGFKKQQSSWIPLSPAEKNFPRHSDDAPRTQDARRNKYHKEGTLPADARRSRLITPHSEYDIIKPLESRPGVPAAGGMNAGIFLLEHRSTRELYVEKRLRMRDETDCARVASEQSALYEIRKAGSCTHIVDVIEAFAPSISPPYCSLVLEYCNSGTVKDFIERYIEERKITPEPFAWHIFAGVTAALCACHYGTMDAMHSTTSPRRWEPICHLDVKPSNIFLTSTGRTNAYPRVVLGDFGCAVREEDIDSGILEQVYTPEWLPPENERSPYGARSLGSSLGPYTDVWQAGAVVQAMCRLLSAPNQGLVEEERPCGSRFTFALNNVISCCMARDPDDRPTAVELVKEIKREMQKQGMSV